MQAGSGGTNCGTQLTLELRTADSTGLMYPQNTRYLCSQLGSGHAKEVTQVIPLPSYNWKLCVPREESI